MAASSSSDAHAQSTITEEPKDQVRALLKMKYQLQFNRITLLAKGDQLIDDDFNDLYLEVPVERWHRDDQPSPHRLFRSVNQMWPYLERRLSLEGPAGSGKSTLCQHVCRQQCWPETFTFVLYVGLPELVKQQQQDIDEGDGEMTLTSVALIACQQLQLTSEEVERVTSLMALNDCRPLFIFDGLDEVESQVEEQSAVGRFLGKLMDNALKAEQCSCILVSRFEKKKHPRDSVRMVLPPWTETDVLEYIDKFFGSAAARSSSSDDVDERKRAAQHLLIERTDLEWTPLVCELVCLTARASDNGAGNPVVNLHHLYSRFEELLWTRWANRQAVEGREELVQQLQTSLNELAFKTLTNSVGEDSINEPRLADTGFFFLQGPVSKALRFLHTTICEHAAARHAYATQLQHQEVAAAGVQAIAELLANLQDQKRFLTFLGLLLQADDNQELKKEMWLMQLLTTRHRELVTAHYAALNQDLAVRGSDGHAREHWAKMLGLNVLVEVATSLDGTSNQVSNWVLGQIQTVWSRFFKAISSRHMTARMTPWVYHLLLDQAARHGNQAMVTRVSELLAGIPAYLHHPMLEAYASRRGVLVRDILLANGAAPVDLRLSARYGHEQAALLRLETGNLKGAELREACKLLFHSDPPFVHLLAPALQRHPSIDPIDRLIFLQFQYPDLVPPAVEPKDVFQIGCTARGESRRKIAELFAKFAKSSLSFDTEEIDAAGFSFICDLLKVNSTLTTLNLSSSNYLGIILAREQPGYKIADQYNYQIGDAGCTMISDGLKTNSTLTTLDLSTNRIGDAGCTTIGDALKINSTLTTLVLYNNRIGDAGSTAVGDALKINSTLTTLDLSLNKIGDAGCTAIGDALKINSTLTTLYLSGNQIGDAGCTAISDALKINSTLTTLYLSHNQIGDAGCTAISDAVKINSTLTTLHLSFNRIGDTGCTAIGDAVKINSTLTTLHLDSNDIGDAGWTAIGGALKINSTLTSLHLSYSQVGGAGCAAIVDALKINYTLTKLEDFFGTSDDAGQRAVRYELKINSTKTRSQRSSQ